MESQDVRDEARDAGADALSQETILRKHERLSLPWDKAYQECMEVPEIDRPYAVGAALSIVSELVEKWLKENAPDLSEYWMDCWLQVHHRISLAVPEAEQSTPESLFELVQILRPEQAAQVLAQVEKLIYPNPWHGVVT